MAGHSQFKNIMHRKEAQDAKRAKRFTKLLREIVVAARNGGVEVESNHLLRAALCNARAANMPKENIERALKKALEGTDAYDALSYEGFGPGSSALIVEVLTDNRNRSSSEIRTLFNKHGGRLADVQFLFNHVGVLIYPKDPQDSALVERAIDEGASDIQENDADFTLLCAREHFFYFKEKLETEFGPSIHSGMMWLPHIVKEIPLEQDRLAFEKFLSALEDHDDVQAVWSDVQ